MIYEISSTDKNRKFAVTNTKQKPTRVKAGSLKLDARQASAPADPDVTQDGSAYLISDAALQTTTPALDRAIKLILETADALRDVQNGQQKL